MLFKLVNFTGASLTSYDHEKSERQYLLLLTLLKLESFSHVNPSRLHRAHGLSEKSHLNYTSFSLRDSRQWPPAVCLVSPCYLRLTALRTGHPLRRCGFVVDRHIGTSALVWSHIRARVLHYRSS